MFSKKTLFISHQAELIHLLEANSKRHKDHFMLLFVSVGVDGALLEIADNKKPMIVGM